MTYRIAVDTGGTFTDVVVTNGDGRIWADKAPSTPHQPFRGMSDALAQVATRIELEPTELLRRCHVLTYATTHAINAVITGRTAKTAFLTTAGFPDTLLLREGGKRGPYDLSQEYPAPYIPRALTFEVRERISSEGDVLLPLDVDQVEALLESLRVRRVEAIGVCLLWAFANPTHELEIGALIERLAPGIPFSLSHEVSPRIREYRRASATVLDASLKPLMRRHFDDIGRNLRDSGFSGTLLVVTSAGGTVPIDQAAREPLRCLSSGPSMAPVAAKASASEEALGDDLIVCDMGGTSFDVSLVRDGKVQFTREAWLGERFVGHITGLASVAVESIGSGGGSIARVDRGGLLHIGPESAGAEPGPAAYGRGGRDATLTDAALTLGYIDPARFLGGRMALDVPSGQSAVSESVAMPLGVDTDVAALGMIAVATANMASAIREITINQGIDPRECVVVAGGGAVGLCIGPILAELGVRTAIIPASAAVLSATGGLHSDIVTEIGATFETNSQDFDYAGVNRTLDGLDASVDAVLCDVAAIADSFHKEFVLEACYRYQVWELEVDLPSGRFNDEIDVVELERRFHAVHERTFGVQEPGQRIECLHWRVRGLASLGKPRRQAQRARAEPIAASSRQAYFPRLGWSSVPCYTLAAIVPEREITGPALLDLDSTTIVLYPGSSVRGSTSGNFILTIQSPQEVDLAR